MSKTEQREAPAYMEYAASIMAKIDFRTMTLSERGLMYSMRLECWVNGKLPSDTTKLAKVLGYDRAEIAACLPAVLPFFKIDGVNIVCPELVNYRANLDDRKRRMSDGGRAGGKKTMSGKALSHPSMQGSSSLDKTNSNKSNQDQSAGKGLTDDEWANEYERASNGH